MQHAGYNSGMEEYKAQEQEVNGAVAGISGGARRTPGRESQFQPLPKSSFSHNEQEEMNKPGSFLSTKRMSEVSGKEDTFEQFLPIIKKLEQEEASLDNCQIHPEKPLQYCDISSPESHLCSECVLDLVVGKNFNTAMTKEEFQKKKQTEEFLNNLTAMSTDLNKIQNKIVREVEELEKTHSNQKGFLDNFFSQLILMIEEVRQRYSNRVEKTFVSIREIFAEKRVKLGRFEKEMKELEKDVRLNYSNIIRLMDLEPFYEIIYRYNKKLGNIKQVFTEFKAKPDEIPENAIRTKDLRQQLEFVSSFGRKLDHFFCDDDSLDTSRASEYERDKHTEVNMKSRNCSVLEMFGDLDLHVFPLVDLPNDNFKRVGSREQHNKKLVTEKTHERAEKSVMTDVSDFDSIKKRVGVLQNVGEAKDDLKVQAEQLIKSVDTLIATGNSHVARPSTQPVKSHFSGVVEKKAKSKDKTLSQLDQRPSKSITKAEIAKRIQAHFNSLNVVGKVRSNSNTNSKSSDQHGKSDPNSALIEKFASIDEKHREMVKSKPQSRDKMGSPGLQSSQSQATIGGSTAYYCSGVSALTNQYSLAMRAKLSKENTPHQSRGKIGVALADNHIQMTSASKDHLRDQQPVASKTLNIAKTEKMLQMYRKNKSPSENTG